MITSAERMTGLDVIEVNIAVSDIQIPGGGGDHVGTPARSVTGSRPLDLQHRQRSS